MRTRREFIVSSVAAVAATSIGIPLPAAELVFNIHDYKFYFDPETGRFGMYRKDDPFKTPVVYDEFVREGLIRHQCKIKAQWLDEQVKEGKMTREQANNTY
jgi:hypothetical protein